jgi:nucleotide-binding universal stress UspA family protein
MTFIPQRVLVAIDGSLASLEASRIAIDLAASWHAVVRAVAVLGKERMEPLVDQAAPDGAGSARERWRSTLSVALDHVVRSGEAVGVSVEPALRTGTDAQPYEAILEEADRWTADVIVVGRGHHHGIGRALLGSQAEQLLEFATLPVIVVPGKAPRES